MLKVQADDGCCCDNCGASSDETQILAASATYGAPMRLCRACAHGLQRMLRAALESEAPAAPPAAKAPSLDELRISFLRGATFPIIGD